MSTSIVLVCAVLASMAAGVLIAYGVCNAMFALFRIHARQVATRTSTSVVAAASIVEG
ncbi:hypothetical protein [Granulicella arctica]|uniref:hypothetical protein n=1 Tax=Granulicella arctica TaxID=940613 RepID=UPI0021E0A475|nr:hypothetical protein [Granulicella arctica]